MMKRIQLFVAIGLIALTATCSFADESSNLSPKFLAGVWHHPFPGAGHWETLTFRKDGTFERVIRHRIGESRISGTFSVEADGNVTLTIRQRGLVDSETSAVEPTDERSPIRTHMDIKNGNDMILTNRDLPIPQYGSDSYYIYSRDYLREDEYNRRRKANIEEMLKMLNDVKADDESESSTQTSK